LLTWEKEKIKLEEKLQENLELLRRAQASLGEAHARAGAAHQALREREEELRECREALKRGDAEGRRGSAAVAAAHRLLTATAAILCTAVIVLTYLLWNSEPDFAACSAMVAEPPAFFLWSIFARKPA